MLYFTATGRLGKDPIMRSTQKGDKVLSFGVSSSTGYGDNKKTIWIECAVWGSRGDALKSMLTKGTSVTVSGEGSVREYNGKTYLTCRCSEVSINGGKRGSGDGKQSEPQYPGIDDDIPF